MTGRRIFVAAVVAVVVVAVIAGLVLIGSPAKERARRMDEKRVRDLSVNAMAVNRYWRLHDKQLPSSLKELSNRPGMRVRLRDPETGKPYAYRRLGGDTYELCAVFTFDSTDEGRMYAGNTWAHGTGRQCFERKAPGSR